MSIQAPKEILDLVERFDRNLDAYRSGQYNETQLRREFLDPFFKSLGWDIDNQRGYAEAYKEVIHEDAIKMGEATKAPDYCFRIGGTRKFFLEAKKPAVDIKHDVSPAFQLRRYAWTAKLPLSILSDFEEFAVYDCRIKPSKDDSAAIARIFYCTFRDYLNKWDYIASIFSPDAVLKGSFDKFAETTKVKKGTAEFDEDFLATIEGWRLDLARNLALRNSQLTQRELNFAVQRIIDRIIFLRICEARGIEDYGRLRALTSSDHIYSQLGQLFVAADARYNSGLFHFKSESGRNEIPDELTLLLNLDDKLLRGILRGLYYPESPYEFAVIPSDILGQVYERFLGKIIHLTESHRADVDDKPEVKKAGGVYYTPTYIVDYIVQQTVGNLIESKTPKQVSKLRVLDPACGSGSFLIGAYQFLLDWYLHWYAENDPTKWTTGSKPALHRVGNGWKLTIDERKRILLNNIFGVDIDPQAVEVTKLSLLLKVLEGETEQSLQPLFHLFHERALPDLGNNIKCGNSLISPDFYEQQELNLLDEEQRYRINVFDWHSEFSEIFSAGGFDAAIGNPPYISVELTIKDVTDYYLKKYDSAFGRANSFSIFVEQANNLLKESGRLGFIVSNRILTNTQLSLLRKLILESSEIQNILTFKKAVFKASVDTAVLISKKTIPTQDHVVDICYDIQDFRNRDSFVNKVKQASFLETPSFVFNVMLQESSSSVIQTIRTKSDALSTICDVKDGIILGAISDSFLSNKRINSKYEKWLEGNEVARYSVNWEGRYICYDNSLVEEELKHKRQKAKQKAMSAADFKKLSQSGVRLRTPEIFRREKLLTRQNAKRLIGTYDNENYFIRNSLHSIFLNASSVNYNLKYILALINSRLLDFYFQDQIGKTGEMFSQMKIEYIRQLPIRPIDFSDLSDKSYHDQLVKLVEQILAYHKKFSAAKTPHERTILERQIDATDTQINHLVYKVYGLTEEDIKIVESGALI